MPVHVALQQTQPRVAPPASHAREWSLEERVQSLRDQERLAREQAQQEYAQRVHHQRLRDQWQRELAEQERQKRARELEEQSRQKQIDAQRGLHEQRRQKQMQMEERQKSMRPPPPLSPPRSRSEIDLDHMRRGKVFMSERAQRRANCTRPRTAPQAPHHSPPAKPHQNLLGVSAWTWRLQPYHDKYGACVHPAGRKARCTTTSRRGCCLLMERLFGQ